MSTAPSDLVELRHRIDELDDALHDVLMARAAVVESIARLKQRDAMPPLRSGREAQIVRRILARHRGPLPKPTLVRLWRELLAGTIAMQIDLRLAVYSPANDPGLWDLARDHYGSHVAMVGFRSAGEVLRAVANGRAILGVLPVPGEGEPRLAPGQDWWRFLGGEAPALRVVAKLPFGARGNARGDGDAFVIAALEPEESGADCSLFLIETGEALSRARLLAALGGVGLKAGVLATSESVPAEAGAGAAALLVEFEGWLAAGDARLTEALAGLGKTLQFRWLGAYARPLAPAELGEEAPR